MWLIGQTLWRPRTVRRYPVARGIQCQDHTHAECDVATLSDPMFEHCATAARSPRSPFAHSYLFVLVEVGRY